MRRPAAVFLLAAPAVLIVMTQAVSSGAVPPAPDYSAPSSWAAHPDRKDMADHVPTQSNLKDRQSTARADVFYVYPTMFFREDQWNASVNDASLNREIDLACVQFQATVFNGSARVYAPRYRQATAYAFLDDSGAGQRAVERAWSDVRRAFRHYLKHENGNRPVILAGHSQGSTMIVRLLQEFFDEKPLYDRLVVAYVVGEFVGEDTFRAIPAGRSPSQTGCFVSWCTVQRGKTPRLVCGWKKYGGFAPFTEHTRRPVCVNPLTWTTDETRADFSKNLGSAPDTGIFSPALEELLPGRVDAQCRDGILWIDPSKLGIYKLAFAHDQGDYHPSDYELFYMNIRQNVAQRVDAFLQNASSRK